MPLQPTNEAIALFKPRLISYFCLGSAAATFAFILAAEIGLLRFNLHHILLDMLIGGILLGLGLFSLHQPEAATRLFPFAQLIILGALFALIYVDPTRQMALFFVGLVILGAFIAVSLRFGLFISVLSGLGLLWLDMMLDLPDEIFSYLVLFYAACILLGATVSDFLQAFLSKIRHYESRLAEQAYTDELTGLLNRRGFMHTAEKLFHTHRQQQRPLSLAIIDLDRFKQLNDQHGHMVGDAALRHIARIIRQVFSETDQICGRVGGDEMMLLLPGVPLKEALTLLTQLEGQLAREPLIHDGQSITMTLSIGVAQLNPITDEVLNDLIRRADTALYQAKAAGRNQIQDETMVPMPSNQPSIQPIKTQDSTQ